MLRGIAAGTPAAKRGLDYRQILNDAPQFIVEANEEGLPEAWINNLLGVDVQPLFVEDSDDDSEELDVTND